MDNPTLDPKIEARFDKEFGCHGYCMRADGEIVYFDDHNLEEADEDIYKNVKAFLAQELEAQKKAFLDIIGEDEILDDTQGYGLQEYYGNPDAAAGHLATESRNQLRSQMRQKLAGVEKGQT